jgi:hypothetical protein
MGPKLGRCPVGSGSSRSPGDWIFYEGYVAWRQRMI